MATHMKGYKYMLGASVAPELIKQIDEYRGEIPRSRIVERALNQFLESNNVKNVEGLKTYNLTAQPATSPTPTSTTSTSTHAGTLEVDSVLRDMATTEGNRRIGGTVDVNGR